MSYGYKGPFSHPLVRVLLHLASACVCASGFILVITGSGDDCVLRLPQLTCLLLCVIRGLVSRAWVGFVCLLA